MLEQVERRVNGTNRRFGEELDEYQANAKLALSMAEHAAKFQQALAAHDAAGAERMVKMLADVYSTASSWRRTTRASSSPAGTPSAGPRRSAPNRAPRSPTCSPASR